MSEMREIVEKFFEDDKKYDLGGGQKAIDKQHAKGRLFVRERLEALFDKLKKGQIKLRML